MGDWGTLFTLIRLASTIFGVEPNRVGYTNIEGSEGVFKINRTHERMTGDTGCNC